MNYESFFYHPWVDLTDVTNHLNKLDLNEDEKAVLLEIIRKTIHVEIVHLVLNQVPEEHHPALLSHLEERPHDRGIGVFLDRSIDGLEQQIKTLVQVVKRDFLESLHDYGQASREWLEGDL